MAAEQSSDELRSLMEEDVINFLNFDMCLDNISQQLVPIIIPPRSIDDDDASPAPSDYEGASSWFAGGFSPARGGVSLLDFALGRPWSRDDTITIFTRLNELENVDHELTDYERESIMQRVVREYLENPMVGIVMGPEWYVENIDDLYVEIQELYDSWIAEGEVGDEEIEDGGGLSSEIISKNLQTRVCGIDVDGDEVCAICCDQFCQGEEAKIGILKCGHEYHVMCIKEWLLKNNVCPLCRAQALERA